MANEVQVSNWPKADSAERVAFDLAIRIAQNETVGGPSLKREAMLRLYAQCIQTVRNGQYAPPAE